MQLMIKQCLHDYPSFGPVRSYFLVVLWTFSLYLNLEKYKNVFYKE